METKDFILKLDRNLRIRFEWDQRWLPFLPTTTSPPLIPFTPPQISPCPSTPDYPQVEFFAASTPSQIHVVVALLHARSLFEKSCTGREASQIPGTVSGDLYYSDIARGYYMKMANYRAVGDFAPMEGRVVVEQALGILAGDNILGEAWTISTAGDLEIWGKDTVACSCARIWTAGKQAECTIIESAFWRRGNYSGLETMHTLETFIEEDGLFGLAVSTHRKLYPPKKLSSASYTMPSFYTHVLFGLVGPCPALGVEKGIVALQIDYFNIRILVCSTACTATPPDVETWR